MRIGIIDAELATGGRRRFPNLACMKMSSFHKTMGSQVSLVQEFDEVLSDTSRFDHIFMSCVFTDTAKEIPSRVMSLPNLTYGGTGFYFDKYSEGPMLPTAIEHSTPDYHLYDDFARSHPKDKDFLTGFSVGFLTRGCFRRCKFCVLRGSRSVQLHSPLHEIVDTENESADVVLLDDNLLGLGVTAGGREDVVKIIDQLNERTIRHKSRYQFKQGLDIRLMRPEYARLLSQARYLGDFIFAWDDVDHQTMIERGISTFREFVPEKNVKFYVLCGYKSVDASDVASVFYRIQVLWKHRAMAYVMRHENCRFADPIIHNIYSNLARWCNQTNFQKKLTFRVFCNKTGGKAARMLNAFHHAYPHLRGYLDMAFEDSPYFGANGINDKWSDHNFLSSQTNRTCK